MHLLPAHITSFYLTVGVVICVFSAGYFIEKVKSIPLCWILVVTSIAFTHWMLLNETPGFRMIALVVVLLQGMKNLSAASRNGPLDLRSWILFSFGWVGMDPGIFRQDSLSHRRGWWRHALVGLSRVLIAIALWVLLRFSAPFWEGHVVLRVVAAGMLLVALSLFLHFGLLRINVAALRYFGYAAPVQFRQPLRAKSLRAFWGRRWNLPFIDMTRTVAYRPSRLVVSPGWALILAFLFSGLLHEVAISLPVMAGFGMPLAYFALQVVAMNLERHVFTRQPGILWVLLWLVVPLPLLFHRPFMEAVVWPFVG